MVPARIRGVIFDGDDTLWLTEALYDDARACARAVIASCGLDAASWEVTQRARDLENVATLGHSVDRFPTSCVEAFLAVGGDQHPDREYWRERVWSCAASVFDASAPLREDARAVLTRLAERGVRLALLTKGDATIQRRRIAESGLESLFDVVRIVTHKTSAIFQETLRALNVPRSGAISVGNSVESDIRPSLGAGIYALWLPAYAWEYERRHDPAIERNLHRIASLSDVSDLAERDHDEL